MSMFNLDGKVAIVTGSSRGIGRASVLRLAESGARVVVSSRKSQACETVADEIRAAGGEAIVVPCNISSRSEMEALVNETMRQWGRIDCLVCNAASNPVYGPMAEIEDSAIDKILANNVRSNIQLANIALPHMAKNERGGSIILISSIAGMLGNRSIGVYGISKAADMQIARNLAVEWGAQGITANCIAPGLIKTDFARALWENPKAKAHIERMTPLGRFGEPDDIAGIVVFLASDAGRFVTGQNIVADGGATIADPL